MKIAYRIITPILAVGAVVMGFFLNLFYFAIGGASDELSSLVQLAEMFNVSTKYEFSAYDLIQLLANSKGDADVSFASVAKPVMPHIIAFIIFFALTLLLFLAVGIVAASTANRKAVIGMSCGGLVLCFVCIIIARLAFDKITGGEIALNDLVSLFSESTMAQLLSLVVTIKSATLSAGFYAVFGMYLLVIFWSIAANMLINTPIQHEKKHRRKKPVKRLSAIIHR